MARNERFDKLTTDDSQFTSPAQFGNNVIVGEDSNGNPYLEELTNNNRATLNPDGTIDVASVSADSVSATNTDTETVSGVQYLLDSMSESTVRSLVSSASQGATFVVEPGASWTLTNSLSPPAGATIYGNSGKRRGSPTFVKGYNGRLLATSDFLTLDHVWLDGNSSNGFTGPGIRGSSREMFFSNCTVEGNAGDGFRHKGTYLSTWQRCRIYDNGGWGVNFRSSGGEQPHNHFYGPTYIGYNGAGGVNFDDNGKNVTIYAWIGNNGGPGVRSSSGFDQFTIRAQITDNDGPAYLHANGATRNITFDNCALSDNCLAPDSGLTTPVGQIHCENGRPDIAIQGGYAIGHSTLYQATSSTVNHGLLVQAAGFSGLHNGDIKGTNTFLTLMSTRTIDGTIYVQSGIGLNPAGGGSVVKY
jgi:hypothetical protein